MLCNGGGEAGSTSKTQQKCGQQRCESQGCSQCFLSSVVLNDKRDVITVQRNMETKGETGEALCFTASIKMGHGF